MKWRDAIKQAMSDLASDPRTIFIGYNVVAGSRAYGTLSDVPPDRCLETPVAENLMAGLAMGLAMEGYRPVLFFERHDFVLNALDALVNHLDKVGRLSGGQYHSPVIIRAVVGGTKPLYPGLQHTQNFSSVFRHILDFPIHELKPGDEVSRLYRQALEGIQSAMFIEERDLYETDCSGAGSVD